MNIIAIINQKGGVGKSTTAHATGEGLKLKGYHVLYIDLDAQANLTHTIKVNNGCSSIMDMLLKKSKPSDCIFHTEKGDIIPSNSELVIADTTINIIGKEFRLRDALEEIKSNYDFIIIDTPPALGILTVNALTACNSVIIPSNADIYSLQGISQLYDTIKTIKKYCNPSLDIRGILLTRYSPRSILSKEMAEIISELATKFNTKLFSTTIREAIAIKEAQAQQTDIYSYAPNNNATKDYMAFVEEFLKGETKQ